MTMQEYQDLVGIEKMKPVEDILDKSIQDRIIGKHEIRQIIDG